MSISSSALNQQAKTANHNQIKNLVKNISKDNNTSINPQLIQAAINYSLNSEDARSLMGCLIDTIDQKASHSTAVYKCLFVIESCLKNNSQHFYTIARSFAPDIRSITLLAFEGKKSPLRIQIHHMALSLYNYLIHSKPISQEQFEADIIQTFQKPLDLTQITEENKQLTQNKDSDSDEEYHDIWGIQYTDLSEEKNQSPQLPETHQMLFDLLGNDEIIEDKEYAPTFTQNNAKATIIENTNNSNINQEDNDIFAIFSNPSLHRVQSSPKNISMNKDGNSFIKSSAAGIFTSVSQKENENFSNQSQPKSADLTNPNNNTDFINFNEMNVNPNTDVFTNITHSNPDPFLFANPFPVPNSIPITNPNPNSFSDLNTNNTVQNSNKLDFTKTDSGNNKLDFDFLSNPNLTSNNHNSVLDPFSDSNASNNNNSNLFKNINQDPFDIFNIKSENANQFTNPHSNPNPNLNSSNQDLFAIFNNKGNSSSNHLPNLNNNNSIPNTNNNNFIFMNNQDDFNSNSGPKKVPNSDPFDIFESVTSPKSSDQAVLHPNISTNTFSDKKSSFDKNAENQTNFQMPVNPYKKRSSQNQIFTQTIDPFDDVPTQTDLTMNYSNLSKNVFQPSFQYDQSSIQTSQFQLNQDHFENENANSMQKQKNQNNSSQFSQIQNPYKTNRP